MTASDLLCFSHLRWNFVFQRPNHLMSRFARDHRVLFIEEPLMDSAREALELTLLAPNLWRVVPHVPSALSELERSRATARLLAELCARERIVKPIHWYYTPMMLAVSEALPRRLVVYDCMDELSLFMHAPRALIERERQLMAEADVVFTGGMALYEHKRDKHPNVHGVPSSVDVAFFAQARSVEADPADQAPIARPRVGYAGVIDERIDLGLIERIARERSEVQLVMLGPVVKIDLASLPRLPNIHYLGGKKYEQLPSYLGGWDVAIMPFALNDATRFISPTKTPEYLAAGKPVVSTAIRDVIEPYERLGLVHIGRDHASFIAHLDALLRAGRNEHAAARDAFLAESSWDATFCRMQRLLHEAETARQDQRSEGPCDRTSATNSRTRTPCW